MLFEITYVNLTLGSIEKCLIVSKNKYRAEKQFKELVPQDIARFEFIKLISDIVIEGRIIHYPFNDLEKHIK